MSDLDPMLANLMAENLALRSLMTGFLFEMIRRGQIGIVSNALAYSNAPLEGLTSEIRPPQAVREKARKIIEELRDELLGLSEANRPEARDNAAQTAQRIAPE
jgi:hypothetical protein